LTWATFSNHSSGKGEGNEIFPLSKRGMPLLHAERGEGK
jgi:hypothetical protein